MPDDDVLADRYVQADATLRRAGFDWYEVSNWATSDAGPLPAQRAVLGQRELVGDRPGRAQPRRRAALVERQAPGRLRRPAGRRREPGAGRASCSTTPTARWRRSCSACGCARACRSTALSAPAGARAADAVGRGLLDAGRARGRPRRPHRPRAAARRRARPRPHRLSGDLRPPPLAGSRWDPAGPDRPSLKWESRPVSGLWSPFRQRRPGGAGGGRAWTSSRPARAASSPPGVSGSPPPALSGGMLLALAMNRRARGLRGLDVLRRSQDRAPPRYRLTLPESPTAPS